MRAEVGARRGAIAPARAGRGRVAHAVGVAALALACARFPAHPPEDGPGPSVDRSFATSLVDDLASPAPELWRAAVDARLEGAER